MRADYAMHAKKARIKYLEKRNHELECAFTEIRMICDKMIKSKLKPGVHRHRNGKTYFEKVE